MFCNVLLARVHCATIKNSVFSRYVLRQLNSDYRIISELIGEDRIYVILVLGLLYKGEAMPFPLGLAF